MDLVQECTCGFLVKEYLKFCFHDFSSSVWKGSLELKGPGPPQYVLNKGRGSISRKHVTFLDTFDLDGWEKLYS